MTSLPAPAAAISLTQVDAPDLLAWQQQRDEAAFARLVQRHSSVVTGICRRRLGCGADADEAAQAVFIVLARRAGAAAGASSLGAWLHGVAIRVCRHAQRAATRRAHYERAAARSADRRPPVPDPTWDDLRPLLDEAIADLSAPQRAALIGHFLEGRTQAAVAASLGIHEDAARKRIAYALEKLRAWFGRRGLTVSAVALASGLAAESATAAEPALVAACTQAGIVPVSAPGAAALATGVTTAMFLKYAAIACAAVLVAGCILTAAMVSSAEPPGDAQEAPAPLLANIYEVGDIHRREVLFPRNQSSEPPDPAWPQAEPAIVEDLDRCSGMAELIARIRSVAHAPRVELVDEACSAADLGPLPPWWSDHSDGQQAVTSILANSSAALIPGLDAKRTLLVTATASGHAHLAANLFALRSRRAERLRADPALQTAIESLQTTMLAAFRNASGSGETWYEDDRPVSPRIQLPTVVPAAGERRFAVIWLLEGRNGCARSGRPLAVATDGTSSLLIVQEGVVWRPGLRPAALALYLRQSLDGGMYAVTEDAWRAAVQISLANNPLPDSRKLYSDVTELVQQANGQAHGF